MNKYNPKLILIIGVFGISLSAIFVKSSDAPSMVLAAYRLMWTVLILIPLSARKALPELRTLEKKDFILGSAAGALFAFHFVSWFQSLKLTSVAVATVLVDTDAIFAALGFAIIMKGKIPKKGIIAIIITVIGASLTALTSGSASNTSISGSVLALIAAILISAYTLIESHLRGKNISTTSLSLITYT